MEGLKIGLKRFFKNKNTVTILAVLLCLFIIYYAYYFRIKSKTDPISVPYALKEISPRMQVSANMVGTIKVPKSMVGNNVIKNSSEVIGKYVSSNAVIPSGSLFYRKVLVNWEDLPSSLYSDIEKGYTVVYLPVTLESTYGNSIFPGNYIDLYYVVTDSNGKLILGKLIESIKVLAVVDSEGNSVFEKSTDLNPPAYLMFAVNEDYHLLLRKASYLSGTIFPVPRNAEYSLKPGETKISSSYLESYILSQTINVSEEDMKDMTTTDNNTNTNTNNTKNNTNNNGTGGNK